MNKIKFGANEVIFKEGEFGKAMYEVCSGTVMIVSGIGTDDAKEITELKKGDLFGEMAIIDIYPRSTSAVAKTDSVILEIPSSKLSDYFKEKPEKIIEIMKRLSARIRNLTVDYMDVCRTISESTDGGKVKPKTDGVLAKLRKFAGIYSRNEKVLMRYEERKAHDAGNELGGIVTFYKKNDIIFKEGDESTCMYDIRRGSVGIYSGYDTPDRKLLVKLPAESFFGEMGMIDNEPRSATAVALEDTSLIPIYMDNLADLFKTNPAKVMMILQHMTERLRKLTQDYVKACKTAHAIVEAEASGEELEPEASELVKFFCEVGKFTRLYYY